MDHSAYRETRQVNTFHLGGDMLHSTFAVDLTVVFLHHRGLASQNTATKIDNDVLEGHYRGCPSNLCDLRLATP
jgi:hypothetical protein